MQMKWKRTLACLVVVLLLGSAAPLTVGAEGGYQVGDTVVYGSYPQTDVTAAMGAALNAQSAAWQSYGYYSGTGDYANGQMTAKDYMQYCDVTYSGQKYRGVKFTQYRPRWTGETTSAAYTDQGENGYNTGTIYWFQYEPLQWRVLDPAAGLVLCETIIDSQPYNNYVLESGTDPYGFTAYWGDASKTYYANNYAESSLRQWLNADFANMALTAAQRDAILLTTLDNSACSTTYSAYGSASTTDKVFLLSYSDMTNTTYGFDADRGAEDPARRAQGSDYAKCQGLYVWSPDECSHWWLRSAGHDFCSDGACYVDLYGWVGSYYYYYDGVCSTFIGVRPALRLNLDSEISESAQLRVTVPDLTVQYRSSGKLAPVVTADEGVKYTLAYSGFDSGIISVDKNGNVTTVKGKTGTTTVTVTATDEYGNTAEAKCTVTVRYAWWQMLIRIFLFGWIWY